MKFASFAAVILSILFALAGCGGSDAPAAPEHPPIQLPEPPAGEPEPPEWPFALLLRQANLCAAPRTGIDPASGTAYPDRQGTLNDELVFLRTYIDLAYLWYDEVPFRHPREFNDPISYFNVLKTPALTASGHPKDKFHFTYDSARWDELQNKGNSIGYGVSWARSDSAALPRLWLATTVEPGSPAAAAGLRRGDQLVGVDGVDFELASGSAAVAQINAGLFPAAAGEAHRLSVRRAGVLLDAAMVSASVGALPVQAARVFETAAGRVGYLNFSNHNAVAERLLMEAVATLQAARIDDLVLDLRYNGGGLLYVASELAYMIAGPQATAGKVFEQAVHNDKTARQPPMPFYARTYGFAAPQPVRQGLELPALNLKRVFVLAGAGTCSASESIINSLRGVDVEVILIGAQTCGKPYAFSPRPNCGITYFAISFQGVNQKGTGDYQDGFAPSCGVPDDLAHAQGDPAEGMLAAALARQASGSCAAPRAALRARMQSLLPVRHPAEESAIAPR